MIRKGLFFLIILLLLLETVSRFTISKIFHTNPFYISDIYLHFYPELKQLNDYQYNNDKINLLILAGSVLYSDTIVVELDKKEISTFFCDPAKILPESEYNIINLAQPGHNSLDSRIKHKFLSEKLFDAVFVYHGINDTRANNIHEDQFNVDYRHIEFYDDLFIVNRHPEIRFFTLPFMIDWTVHSVQKKKKFYIPKEMFPGLLNGEPEEYVLAGDHTRSVNSFKNNLLAINKMAKKRNELFFLSTYAWYQPSDYSLERFKISELDYAQQIFPTELYGMPDRVIMTLKLHNEAISEICKEQYPICMDLEADLPDSAQYHDDICHLTKNGCELMSTLLDKLITESALGK